MKQHGKPVLPEYTAKWSLPLCSYNSEERSGHFLYMYMYRYMHIVNTVLNVSLTHWTVDALMLELIFGKIMNNHEDATVRVNKNVAHLRKSFLLLCFFAITNAAPEDTHTAPEDP